MANGGGVVIPVSRRAQQPRASSSPVSAATWLPLDVIVSEIAARSDPATLVRCAATCRAYIWPPCRATCRAARRRIAEDYANLRRRLRDTGMFLPPLLRGHLAGIYDRRRRETTVYLVDTTTAADATRLLVAKFATDAAEAERLMDPMPVESRGGLVLVSATATATPWPPHQTMLVCNPATGGRLVLPPEPEPFPYGVGDSHEQYVLLVGDRDEGGDGADTAVGRPFQVLKVKLALSNSNGRRLMVQTFSSEHGAWSPLTEIPTPNIHGRSVSLKKVVVVGDVVHWLCLTEVGSYVLMFHVREARVSETALPVTFPRYDIPGIRSYLLATDSAGCPIVLVADAENNIRAWEQCKGSSKSKMTWKAWPQVVLGREAILGFNDEMKEAVQWCNNQVARRWMEGSKRDLELLWFGERSGVVLLRTHGWCLLWLDLHSKKIVRCFCADRRMQHAQVYCPYEMDVSSWTPTFSSAVSTI